MKSLYDNKHEAEMIDKLKSLEVLPPNDLWNDIEATLNAKRRKRIFIISTWASAATIALLFTIGGLYNLQSRVEIPAAINHIDNSKLISSNKKTVTHSSSTIQTLSVQNPKRENEQIARVDSSMVCDENNSQGIIARPLVPNKLSAIQPRIISTKATIPRRIGLPYNNNINKDNLALALNETTAEKQKGNWYLSASGFPVYSFHSAGALNKKGTQQQSGIVSWGGSVSMRYAFANRISIETGLTYSIMGQQEKDLYLVNSSSKNIEVYNKDGLTNNYGTLEVSNSDFRVMDIAIANDLSYNALNESNFKKIDALQRFRYIEVPIILSKGFYHKGYSFFIKGGVSAGLLVQNQLDLKGSNIHIKGRTNGIDKYLVSAITSVGLSIPITNNVNFLIEPSLKFSLKSISNTTGKSFPFSSFIKFGIEIPI